jgi:hypothetical protein
MAKDAAVTVRLPLGLKRTLEEHARRERRSLLAQRCHRTRTSRRYGDCCGARSGSAEAAVAREYVLDTHACVFMLTAPRKLGGAARAALGRALLTRDGGIAESGLVETVWA